MAGLTYALFGKEKSLAYWNRLAQIKASGARQAQFDGQMVTFRSSAEIQAEIDAIVQHIRFNFPDSIPQGPASRRRRGIRTQTSGKGFR